ncbi:MAG: recombinase RecT [Christensenellaceae bacterium]|nr:recombinase RecT [Christensenellaceae bacterium]
MEVTNTLNPAGKRKPTFSEFISNPDIRNRINKMLDSDKRSSFITSLVSAVSQNPLLQDCENHTVFAAGLVGASLNLNPSQSLGQFYIIPYNKKAQFQMGYKGFIQLAIRSGFYKKLNVLAIKAGELIKYDPLNEEIEVNLIEDDSIREETDTIGYYAFFEYLNGFKKTMYWSRKKMELHANKYSQSYRSDQHYNKKHSFWSKDFDAMAFKTLLKQLISKWGIMSLDLQTAIEKDQAVLEQGQVGQGQGDVIDYVDNKNNNGEVIENEKQSQAVKVFRNNGVVDVSYSDVSSSRHGDTGVGFDVNEASKCDSKVMVGGKVVQGGKNGTNSNDRNSDRNSGDISGGCDSDRNTGKHVVVETEKKEECKKNELFSNNNAGTGVGGGIRNNNTSGGSGVHTAGCGSNMVSNNNRKTEVKDVENNNVGSVRRVGGFGVVCVRKQSGDGQNGSIADAVLDSDGSGVYSDVKDISGAVVYADVKKDSVSDKKKGRVSGRLSGSVGKKIDAVVPGATPSSGAIVDDDGNEWSDDIPID